MSKNNRIRLVLLVLLVLCLSLASVVGMPKPAEAACASVGCGNWMYNGCCAVNKLYQYRQCCNNGSCCFQYRCNTAALCPI